MSTAGANRRQKILDAALRVFAKHGFHGATIKQVAREARLKSPALIYWYFKNKDELFQAVLIQHAPYARLGDELSNLMDCPPEQVLPLIAQTIFEAFEDVNFVRLFRIFISEVARRPKIADYFVDQGIMKVLDLLISYLRHQVDLGKLRPHDPQSAARLLGGAVISYLMARELFPPVRDRLPQPERYTQEVVAIFLDGLRPERERKE